MTKHVDIVFDGPPGPEAGRFVEVENESRQSIKFGQWIKRDDGYWVLRIILSEALTPRHQYLNEVAAERGETEVSDAVLQVDDGSPGRLSRSRSLWEEK